MSRRAPAPKPVTIIVCYEGRTYVRNLAKCRRALFYRQMEGEMRSVRELASAAGVGMSSARAFLNGSGQGSMETTMKILGALRLQFEEVHIEVEPESGTARPDPGA